MFKKNHFIKQNIYNRAFIINNIKNKQSLIVDNSYREKSYNQIKTSLYKIEKLIYKKFNYKYSTKIKNLYYIKISNEIVCNYNSHIVAQFKDYLIRGDYSEYLSKFNTLKESKILLENLFEFYQKFSLIFPNYVILPESKYIYKNIKRKQKIINFQQEEERKENIIFNLSHIKNNTIFTTQALDSIFNLTDTSGAKQYFEIGENDITINSDNKNKIINIIKDIDKFDEMKNNLKKIKLNKLDIKNKYLKQNNKVNENLKKNLNDINLNNKWKYIIKDKNDKNNNYSFNRSRNNLNNYKTLINNKKHSIKKFSSSAKKSKNVCLRKKKERKTKKENKNKLYIINKDQNNRKNDKSLLNELLSSTTYSGKNTVRTFQGLNSHRDLKNYLIKNAISDKICINNNCKSKSKSKNKNSQSNKKNNKEKNIPHKKNVDSNNIKPMQYINSFCYKKSFNSNINKNKRNSFNNINNQEQSNSKNKTSDKVNSKSNNKNKKKMKKRSRNNQNNSELNNFCYTTTYMKKNFISKEKSLKYNLNIKNNTGFQKIQNSSKNTNEKNFNLNSVRNNDNILININEDFSDKEKNNDKSNNRKIVLLKKNNYSNITNTKNIKVINNITNYKPRNQNIIRKKPKISNINYSKSMMNIKDKNIHRRTKTISKKKNNNKMQSYRGNSRNKKNVNSSSSKSLKRNNLSNYIVNNFLNTLYYTNYSVTPFKKNDDKFEKVKYNILKYKTNYNFNKLKKNKKTNSSNKQNSSNDSINNLSNNINLSRNEYIVKEERKNNYKHSFYEGKTYINNYNQINLRNNSNKCKKNMIKKKTNMHKGIHIKGFEKLLNKKNSNKNKVFPMSITERIKQTNIHSSFTNSNRNNNNISNYLNNKYNCYNIEKAKNIKFYK